MLDLRTHLSLHQSVDLPSGHQEAIHLASFECCFTEKDQSHSITSVSVASPCLLPASIFRKSLCFQALKFPDRTATSDLDFVKTAPDCLRRHR